MSITGAQAPSDSQSSTGGAISPSEIIAEAEAHWEVSGSSILVAWGLTAVSSASHPLMFSFEDDIMTLSGSDPPPLLVASYQRPAHLYTKGECLCRKAEEAPRRGVRGRLHASSTKSQAFLLPGAFLT